MSTISDPKIQAIFAALDDFAAGTDWTQVHSSVSKDGTGTIHTINCQDQQQNSVSYSERAAGVKVSINPPSASLGGNESLQFTASAAKADGTPIPDAKFLWSLPPTALGHLNAGYPGLYSAPPSVPVQAIDTLTATLEGDPAWASASIVLHV